MIHVDVRPALVRGVRERAEFSGASPARRFPKLETRERGEARPTLRQIEDFSKATYTPIGFLFLQEPPVASVPIPDFRTVENVHLGHPRLASASGSST
jgi:hypothetical protein